VPPFEPLAGSDSDLKRLQVIAERAQQSLIGLRVEPPDAVVLVLFFDHRNRRSPVPGSYSSTPMFTIRREQIRV